MCQTLFPEAPDSFAFFLFAFRSFRKKIHGVFRHVLAALRVAWFWSAGHLVLSYSTAFLNAGSEEKAPGVFVFHMPEAPDGSKMPNAAILASGMEGRFVDDANVFAIDDIDDISDGLKEIEKIRERSADKPVWNDRNKVAQFPARGLRKSASPGYARKGEWPRGGGMKKKNVALVILALLTPSLALAHGGGLDAIGCHHDRKRGGYHCHRGSLAGQSFANEAEALAALREAKKDIQDENVQKTTAGK